MFSMLQLFCSNSENCSSALPQLRPAREKFSITKRGSKTSKMQLLGYFQTRSKVVAEEHCPGQPASVFADEKLPGIMGHPEVKKREPKTQYQILENKLKYSEVGMRSIKQRHERDMKAKDDLVQELESHLETLREMLAERDDEIEDLEQRLSATEDALAAKAAALQKEKAQRIKSGRRHVDLVDRYERQVYELKEEICELRQSSSHDPSSFFGGYSENKKRDNTQEGDAVPHATNGTVIGKRSLRELLEDSTADEDKTAHVSPQADNSRPLLNTSVEEAQTPKFAMISFYNNLEDLLAAASTDAPVRNPTTPREVNDYIYSNLDDLDAAASTYAAAPMLRASPGPVSSHEGATYSNYEELVAASAYTPTLCQTPAHQRPIYGNYETITPQTPVHRLPQSQRVNRLQHEMHEMTRITLDELRATYSAMM